jgi:tetratricopeptide (TPR) repeat protein
LLYFSQRRTKFDLFQRLIENSWTSGDFALDKLTIVEAPSAASPPSTDPRVAELIHTSKRLIAQGKAVQALASLRKALEIDQEDTGAKELRQMVEQDIKRTEAEDLLRRGQECLKEGRYDIALKAFEKILKINPNHSKAKLLVDTVKNEIMVPQAEDMLAKARGAYNEKKYALAMKLVDEVLVMYPQNREAQEISMALKERMSELEFNELLLAGQSLLDRGEAETAIKAFEKALKIFPQHPVALKRLEDATSHGKPAEPVDIERLMARGNQQLELGKLEDARRTFVDVLGVQSENHNVKIIVEKIEDALRRAQVKQWLN